MGAFGTLLAFPKAGRMHCPPFSPLPVNPQPLCLVVLVLRELWLPYHGLAASDASQSPVLPPNP
eukprot:scaffold112256_cov18-Tisochrysis_lutea.AAC.1